MLALTTGNNAQYTILHIQCTYYIRSARMLQRIVHVEVQFAKFIAVRQCSSRSCCCATFLFLTCKQQQCVRCSRLVYYTALFAALLDIISVLHTTSGITCLRAIAHLQHCSACGTLLPTTCHSYYLPFSNCVMCICCATMRCVCININ
jgi:hypothetical protein